MRAVVIETRDLTSAQVHEVPRPQPQSGQVLVRMESAPINPSDLQYILGHYAIKPTLPAIPGFEGAGTVVESGGGLLGGSLVGKRVGVVTPGTWAEYVVIEAESCMPLKDEVDFDQAACIFVNPMTVLMFREVIREGKHKACVQDAANSALGKMLIRLCRLEGIPTINVVRSEQSAQVLRDEGAENVLVSTADDFLPTLKTLCTQLEASIAFDAVGGEMTGQLLSGLVNGGVVYVYGLLSGQPSTGISAADVIFCGKKVAGLWLSQWFPTKNAWTKQALASEVQDHLNGALKSEIAHHFPLEQIQSALAAYTTNMSLGKTLLHPNRH